MSTVRQDAGPPEGLVVDRASLMPAGLAALAEAGVIFLPLQEVVRELTGARGGPLMSWPAFGAMFVGGVVAATAWRLSKRSVPVALAATILVAVVQSWGWGHGWPFTAIGVALLSLAATLRVMTLAARDWREPIGASVAGGTLVLLFEVAIGSGAPPPWPALIGPIVVVFFVASLASRAASVRIEATGAPRARLDRELRGPGTTARVALPALAVLAVALVVVATGSGAGGFLHRIGRGLAAGVGALLTAMAWIVSPLVVPIAWLARFVHVDLYGVFSRLSERMQLPASIARSAGGRASVMERGLELVSFLAIAALIVWLIRRRRRSMLGPIGRHAPPVPEASTQVDAHPGPRGRRGFGLRRELPEVTVRRWYAEALLALERRDLRKPGHLTPAEFAPVVGRAFPAGRSAFEQLTHAYEDVRYGEREITHRRLSDLKERRSLLLETFRSAARADAPAAPAAQDLAGIEAPGPTARS